MESQCHLGNIIEYDTITNLSWASRLTTHPIATVIESILSKPWPAAEEQGLEVPAFKRQDDCIVRMRFSCFCVGFLTSLAGLFPMGIWELYIVDYY